MSVEIVLSMFKEQKTHQVNSGVQFSDEFPASLLGLLDFSQGLAVGPLSQPGGEGAQADIVVRLPLLKASHGFCLQLCHEEEETRTNNI